MNTLDEKKSTSNDISEREVFLVPKSIMRTKRMPNRYKYYVIYISNKFST